MTTIRKKFRAGGWALAMSLAACAGPAMASSHMDAPLITLDPAANTTDVYAFVGRSPAGKVLNVALGVYPFQEPGIGPNKYNFDDNVSYQIHVSLGDDVAAGRATISYTFRFRTIFRNENTILQSYLGVINRVGDANQNLVQRYSVIKTDNRTNARTVLGAGIVPPNNQGIATPFYQQQNDGNQVARDGFGRNQLLDRYTRQSIAQLSDGYRSFAGQRDDGFYGDIQAIFDLLQLRSPGVDAQKGYNIHMMSLQIPIAELGGSQQVVGVHATTSRRQTTVLSEDGTNTTSGPFVQVGRQGNPLFNEALVAIVDKDLYSRTTPETDGSLFRKYAESPELCTLLNAIVVPGSGLNPCDDQNRTDLVGIFIPDTIKVDLSTPTARLAGGAPNVPDDGAFSRLSIFGGDTLQSNVQDPFANGGQIPGGWPNGRRFGDDVVDIAVTAVLSDLRTSPPTIQGPAGDNVDSNDRGYSKQFPYESTPHNGRNHTHH